jgi:hypothetical protein
MSENIKNLWEKITSKPIYLVIIGLMLATIVSVLFYLNSNRKVNVVQSDSATQTGAKPSLVKNFADAANLVKVSDTPALSSQLFFFGEESDSKPSFISQNANFVQTGNVLQSKKLFVPDTIYDLGNNSILINQGKESYKLDNTDGNSVLLASNIFSITPLNGKYFFIQNREDEYVIKRSPELILSDPETLTIIPKTELGEPDFISLRLLNDVPYLVTSKVTSDGFEDLTIYRFGKILDKKLEIPNVYSQKYGYNKLLISSLDAAKNSNTQLIDFTNPDKPIVSYIDFRQELGQTARGKIAAQRCAIANGENKILCMVKQNEAAYFDETQRDVFVEYDIDNQTTKILYEGFNISASSVYYSPSNQVFIIGQENGLIYRFSDK